MHLHASEDRISFRILELRNRGGDGFLCKKTRKLVWKKGWAPHQSEMYVKSLNAMANQQEVADNDQ